MSRYIEADALEEKAKQYSLGYYEADEWAVPLCEISEAPSIDIIRCKECEHRHKTDRGITYCDCITYGFNHIEDDFCSHGERKGE